ncbi:unnamed protein product [Owenia fusiformis]|uniref:Kazal-like domain-containing protein n=1 Tax=Owenia fusiformis TaxID=6347 RepID=A0A8S4Q803_OWEFU|nr:unnamed protein product [Owenia fusiformis]
MFTVPVGSYVRVPASNSHANCHKVCRCGHRKGLEHCRSMKCTKHDSCIVGAGHIHDHGSKFHTGCNRCVCQAGEVICSKRQCSPVHSSKDGLSGLPCNCPAIYDPVCGANGRTYHSECMARCSGNIDFLRGACKDYDPCQREPCGQSFKCLERRRVCLSTDSKVCKQYECVSLSLVCNRHHHDPVCSVGRIEFNNICQLWASGKDFAHRGHCKDTCNMVGEVCGHDGVTYYNECSAWGQRMAVHYEGQCKAVGTIALVGGDTYCEGIDCPVLPVELPVEHCSYYTTRGMLSYLCK